MFCPQCGAEFAAQETNEKGNKKNFGKAFVAVLIIAVLLAAYIVADVTGIISLGRNSKSAKAEGSGYNSPKECMEAYMEYMKNADYQGMLSCYAIETAVEKYDMEAYIDRMQCITPTFDFINTDDEFSTALSNECLRTHVFRTIRYGSWYLYGDTIISEGLTYAMEDDEDASDLIEKWLPSDMAKRLSKIDDVEVVDSDDEIIEECLSKDYIEEQLEKFEKIYGVDDYQPSVVAFSIGSDDYYFMADCMKYGNKWYLCPSNAMLASIYGIAINNGGMTYQEDIDTVY